MDPVVHHSLSPYNAFDNNPVFWADPSGADSQTLFDLEGGKHTVSGDDVVNLWKSSDSNEVTLDGIFGYFNLDFTPDGNFDGSGDKEKDKGKKQKSSKSNYATWQNKGQKIIKKADAWLAKHYAEGTATIKVGTYIDVGVKHTARVMKKVDIHSQMKMDCKM